MRHRHLALSFALLALGGGLFLSGTAKADMEAPGVRVSIEGIPRAATTGELFEGVIRISSEGDWELTDFGLSGSGWTPLDLESADRYIVLEDDILQVPFRAVPSNPSEPLVFEWTRDGIRESHPIDLSPAALERIRPKMAIRTDRDSAVDPSTLEPPPYDVHPNLIATDGFLPPSGLVPGQNPDLDSDLNRDPELDPNLDPNLDGDLDGDTAGRSEPILVTGILRSQQAESGQWYNLPGVIVQIVVGVLEDPVVGWADQNGHFAIEVVPAWLDPTPDIQVFFGTQNDHARVTPVGYGMDHIYLCQSEVFYDVSGPTLDVGYLTATGAIEEQAFYIAETIRRSWKLVSEEYGMDIPDVWVGYPHWEDNDYINDLIQLTEDRGYSEWTILHEYGHHWHDHFAWMPTDWTYCNDECDSDNCGHCPWCQESEAVAWFEGIAQFFSRISTDHIKDQYWMPSDDHVSESGIHTIGSSSGCNNQDPMPQRTENYVAAVMYDLCDSDSPEDDPATPGYADMVEGMDHEVFDILTSTCPRYGHYPHWIYDFLFCFKDAYPSAREDMWETARNNWFFLDEEDPEAPMITDWSPDIWTPSTDATVWVMWDRPVDDASGVGGYSISWSSPNQADPGFTTDIGDVIQVTSDPLSYGSQYYFNIRTKDRDGNWSDAYSSIGPFQLLIPDGADLEYYPRTGWDYEVVPRKTPDAGTGDVHVSVNLEGGVNNTYWNVSGKNDGDVPSNSCEVAVYVDDEIADSSSWPYLGSGVGGTKYNQGPVTVPAGRHMFGMFLDSDETIAEQSESNNYRAGQWCWRPMEVLPEDQLLTYSAPPPVTGGWSYFGFEQPLFWNCDGHRSGSSITYQAVYMYPTEMDVDYDLRVFGQESLPEAGYLNPIGESTRPEGSLEAVLWYGLNQGLDNCNIGVYNMEYDWNWGTSNYKMERVVDELIGQGYGRYEANLSSTQMMKIWSIQSEGAATLKLTIATQYSPPIYIGYFEPDFVAGGLLDASQVAIATPGNPAVIEIDGTEGFIAGVAVWRELDADLAHPELVYLDFELDKPDLVAEAPTGWFAPLVPREEDLPYPWPTMDPPAHLTGNTQSTHLYIGEINDSRMAAGEHTLLSNLDGDYFSSWTRTSGVPAHGDIRFTSASTYTVPGGRHTLSLYCDRYDELDEVFEDNNGYGRQWVWSPYDLDDDVIRSFVSLSDATGGWDEITWPPPGGEDPFLYNCEGVRTESYDPRDGRFAIAYALPDAGNDVDLRLHPVSTGAQNGFGDYFAGSFWRTGEADFVVADLDETSRVRWDLGLVEMGGSGGVTVQTDQSSTTVIDRNGTYGPFLLERRDMVDIFHLSLRPGTWPITIRQTGGDAPVDFGLSIHPAIGDPYSTRSDAAHYGGLSWEAPRGDDESVLLTAYVDTEVALAVWRADRAETNVELEYEIIWGEETSGMPWEGEDLPTTTRLLPASPNPFGGETTLWFELAQPTDVQFHVYDVDGSVLREKKTGLLPPGRHPFIWDGRRNGGGEAPSGVYFVRMQAGEHRSVRRVLRIR